MKQTTLVQAAALALAVLATACGPKAQTDTAPPEPAPAPAPAEPVVEKEPVPPIPAGMFAITPTLTVKGVDAAVDFYVKALGAEKLMSMAGPNGETMHAEIKIGDSVIMIGEENLEEGMKSPLSLGGTPAGLMIFTEDADAAFARATAAGAKPEMPVDDMFWGDRFGTVVDPFGHRWSVATHVEELTGEQIQQRADIISTVKNPKKAAKKWKAIKGTPATQKQPSQYHTVTLALTVANADEAIKQYTQAFDAKEITRMPTPDGKIMHAELMIGDSRIMLNDEMPEMGTKSAKTLGGSPVGIMMYTVDVDIAFTRATNAKAAPAMPVTDMFWGDRYGAVVDGEGYFWGLATRVENLTPEEMAERMKAQAPPQS